jgi:hypothetical protein
MDFMFSRKVEDLQLRLREFMDEFIYPNEGRFHDEIERNRSCQNRESSRLRLTCVSARTLSISQHRSFVQMRKRIKRTQTEAIIGIGKQELAEGTIPDHPRRSKRVLR